MPEICRFFGIVIYIYYNEHNPPHFHAVYGSDEALIEISRLTLLKGTLPPKAIALVMEWAFMHRDELLRAWNQAAECRKPDPIEPLR